MPLLLTGNNSSFNPNGIKTICSEVKGSEYVDLTKKGRKHYADSPLNYHWGQISGWAGDLRPKLPDMPNTKKLWRYL